MAVNIYGNSEMSPVGGLAYITIIPDAPVNLISDAAITDAGVIGLDWEEGSSNGGSIIIDYTIQYAEESSSTWITLAELHTEKTYTVTGLVAGTDYKFQVKARN
jgi:hypothetical protein